MFSFSRWHTDQRSHINSYFLFFLQLRQQMIYCTHVTFHHNWECHRSRAKNQKGPFWHERAGSHCGQGRQNSERCFRSIETSSRQRHAVQQIVTQTSTSFSFAPQPMHLLHPLLCSHAVAVSQKIVVRPRDNSYFYQQVYVSSRLLQVLTNIP